MGAGSADIEVNSEAPAPAGSPAAARSQLDHYVTLVLAFWTVVGLFVDVWSHGQALTETFFSPFHALFYSGFLATAAWLLRPLWPSRGMPRPSATHRARDLAPGQRIGIIGLGVFALGGLTDVLWHQAYGFERGVEALMSPPHLILFVGLILIAATPLIAAWTGPSPRAASFRALVPALMSLALVMLVVSMGIIHLWGFASAHYITPGALDRIAREFVQAGSAMQVVYEVTRQRAIANILLTNLILLAPVLLLVRRWRLPFGAITLIYTLVGTLMAAVTGFWYASVVPIPIAAGLAADGLVARLDPSPARPAAVRLFSVLVPVVTWSLYFGAMSLQWGVAWTPTLWAGTILWTGASGLALSVLAVPAASPEQPS